MQTLVYIFISLAGFAIAATAYFGLTFTPIEAALAGFVASTLAVVMLERALRRRAEQRLERGIEDLSRLLSTDAQAGQVLSQRINDMTDVKAGSRLETIEADMSVLGTVVRQVAEAVAEIEDTQEKMSVNSQTKPTDEDDRFFDDNPQRIAAEAKPLIPLEEVQRALQNGQVYIHAQPIVALPQRQVRSYDLMPRMRLDNDEFVGSHDFMPRKGEEHVVRQIEQLGWDEAFSLAREKRAEGEQISLFVPISKATLSDPESMDRAITQLESSRALAKDISFTMAERQWRSLNAMERHTLAAAIEKGVGISLADVTSLRLDYSDLVTNGVRSIRVDATRFIDEPEKYTDFHSSDVASYIHRFGVELIVTGVLSEQHILSLVEDEVRLAQGDYIAPAGDISTVLNTSNKGSAPARRRAAT